MKKAIVTGATSMIGQALIEQCVLEGIEVCAVVREGCEKLDRLAAFKDLTIVYCNLDALVTLPQLIQGEWDTFYHIAWGYTGAQRDKSILLQKENIDYTLQAVSAASKLGCKRFIGAGSQAEYGPLDLEKIGPDTPANPVTAYGVCKLSANRLSKILCKELGIDWIWPRIFSVYGAYDKPTTMIASAVRALKNGEETAFTPAEQQWDYLYAKDAGRAYYLIGQKGKDGAIYCIGSGKAKTLKDYIYEIRDIVAPEAEPGIGKKPYGSNQVMHLCADITSLQADTGFEPVYDFSAGIRDMI